MTIEGDWITDKREGLLRKINNMASTVSILITNDQNRWRELELYALENGLILGNKDKKNSKRKVINHDGWKGLSEVVLENVEGSLKPAHRKMNVDNMDMMAMNMFEGELQIIDKALKGETTVVMFEGLIEENKLLNLALNSWSMDDQIFARESAVCVFVPNKDIIPMNIRKKCNVIEIPPSSVDERKFRIMDMARGMGVGFKDESELTRLVEVTSGLDLTQIESALLEAYSLYEDFNLDHISKVKGEIISREAIVKVKMNGKLGFERVGGYKPLKDFIRKNIISVIRNPERAKHFNLTLPKGCMVFGMGGTGKTIMAEALSKELALPFVEVNVQNIFSKYVGDSEQRMEEITKLIDYLSPCLVYIDEIDALGGSREGADTDSGASRKVMSVLMQWLAKPRNSLVWATTNRIQDIDPAFKRVGRFDFIVPQLLPDTEARREILKVHLEVVRVVPHTLKDGDLQELAESTEYYNGAELENLVHRATVNAFHTDRDTVSMEDMKQALKDIRVNKDERRKQQDEYMKIAEQFVNDTTFLEAQKSEAHTPMSRTDIVSMKIKNK